MNPWPDSGQQIARVAGEFAAHSAHALLHDAGQGTAPSGVKCAYGFSFRISKKDWKAIGGLYGQDDASNIGDHAVAGQPVIWDAGDAMNDVRVHLAQPCELKIRGRPARQYLQKPCAILLAVSAAFAAVAESSKGARTEGVKQPRLPGQLLGA